MVPGCKAKIPDRNNFPLLYHLQLKKNSLHMPILVPPFTQNLREKILVRTVPKSNRKKNVL